MTTDQEPAAGTGGAAECRFCGCAALPPEVPCASAEKALAGCPWLSREERAELCATLNPDAPAPSAVPERAAGGGGVPASGDDWYDRNPEIHEAMVELVSWAGAAGVRYGASSYTRIPATFTEAGEWIDERITNLRVAIDRARLAQPRPAAADEGGTGRDDAGAVREAAHRLERANDRLCAVRSQTAYLAMMADPGASDALHELDDARRQVRAALDRAGEGSAPGSEAAPPSTSTEISP